MHIVFTPAHNFIPYLGVTICSVCESNAGAGICFHVIAGSDITAADRSMLEGVALRYGQRIEFHPADGVAAMYPEDFFTRKDKMPAAVYYRLLLPTLLPENVERVIYLDVDLVDVAGLQDMWEMDMHGAAVAAAPDFWDVFDTPYRRLGYDRSLGYFNAGVMLLDLALWRREGLQDECLRFWHEHPGQVLYHDQDILNRVLRERKTPLPLRYNLQEVMLQQRTVFSRTYEDAIVEALRNPAIIHYTTPVKPWTRGCRHPLRRLFFEYRRRSGLSVPILPGPAQTLKQRIKRITDALGITEPAIKYRRITPPKGLR